MSIKISYLKTFVQVVETGSMSQAAQLLRVSHSAVSQKIKSLEEEMGQPLLERQATGIKLFPLGQIIYEHAKEILHDIEGLTHIASHFQKIEMGRIKISAPGVLIRAKLFPSLARIKKKMPNIEIVLKPLNLSTDFRALLADQIDCLFVAEDEYDFFFHHEGKNSDLSSQHFCYLDYRFAFHSEHPLADFQKKLLHSRKKLLPFHLKNYSIVLLDEQRSLKKWVRKKMTPLALQYRFVKEVPDFLTFEAFLGEPFFSLGLLACTDVGYFDGKPIARLNVQGLSLVRGYLLITKRRKHLSSSFFHRVWEEFFSN